MKWVIICSISVNWPTKCHVNNQNNGYLMLIESLQTNLLQLGLKYHNHKQLKIRSARCNNLLLDILKQMQMVPTRIKVLDYFKCNANILLHVGQSKYPRILQTMLCYIDFNHFLRRLLFILGAKQDYMANTETNVTVTVNQKVLGDDKSQLMQQGALCLFGSTFSLDSNLSHSFMSSL